ncbi:MAG: hypothetical protein ACRETC_08515 [Gammaproteobacteria bacterium]
MKNMKWVGLIVSVLVLGACAQPATPNAQHISAGEMHSIRVGKIHKLAVKACTQSSKLQCVTQPFTVTLTKRNGSKWKRIFDPPIPVIHNEDITVFAGQTLNIEATPGKNGKLTHLKLVQKVTHPDSTLIVKLEQASGKEMILNIHNPFPHSLLYKAEIRPLDAGFSDTKAEILPVDAGFSATDVCPVGPKLENFESWPGPLFQVRLSDMRLANLKGKKVTC